MLISLEDEKRSLTASKKRIDILAESFLEGFGPLPKIQKEVLTICEMLHRITSAYGTISNKSKRLHQIVEKHLCLKANAEILNKMICGDRGSILFKNEDLEITDS